MGTPLDVQTAPDAGIAPDVGPTPDVVPVMDATPDVAPDVGTASDVVDVPDAGIDVPRDSGPADVGCTGCGAVAPPRPLSPLTGSHAVSRRPILRWSLAPSTSGARVSVCRDRALTVACVTFDATGAGGAPASDLAPGVWFWGLRGRAAGVTGTATSAVWRIVIGTSASHAGAWGGDLDVNGDGYADVIAAEDTGLALDLYLGGPSGPPTTPVQIRSPAEASSFGYALVDLGDVDGDGYGDVGVGTWRSDLAYVYYGSATGLGPRSTAISGARGSNFGFELLGPGDYNGDGYNDLVALLPAAASLGFFPGGPGGIATTATAVITPPPPYNRERDGVAVGDVNGDGYSDLVTGTQTPWLYLGGGGGLTRNLALPGLPVRADDVNGDGYADMLLESDRLSLGLGGPGGLASVVPVIPQGSYLASSATILLLAPGDFDGDGRTDLARGNGGTLSLFPGTAAGFGAPTTRLAGFDWPAFARLTGVGDVNGDGYEDVIHTIQGAGVPTRLRIERGSATGLNFPLAAVEVTPPDGRALTGVTAAGDLDHDGHADLLVTTVFNAYAYPGTATGFGAPTRFGDNGLQRWAVGAGDVNRDGYDDVLYKAALHLGSASGVSTTRLPLPGVDGYFEEAGVGDVDHDGYDDVALLVNGMPRTVRLFRGTATGVAAVTPVVTLPAGEWSAIAPAGDVNHDGYADAVVSNSMLGGGVAYLLGSATGFRASVGATASGQGFATGVGDVDRDGYDDVGVILGPRSAWTAASIFAGGSTGLSTTGRSFTAFVGTQSRVAVASAGDFDRDGFGDVALTGDNQVEIHRGSAAGVATAAASVWPIHQLNPSLGGTDLWPLRPLALLGDVDGDGRGDLAVARTPPNNVWVAFVGHAPAPAVSLLPPSPETTFRNVR